MIHPLWSICILFRIAIIFAIYYIKNTTISAILLLLIGLGFLYKSLTGSNNETQIAKVFWHETRLIHSIFYILAALFCFIQKPPIISMTVISLDLLFSIIFRITYSL